MINFTFVGNAVTNLFFTDSINDSTAKERHSYLEVGRSRMKNTATNEYLSEDKF